VIAPRRLARVASRIGRAGRRARTLLVATCVIAHVASAAEFAYVGNFDDQSLSVIDLGGNVVVGTIALPDAPWVVAVDPGGTRALVGYEDAGATVVDLGASVAIGSVVGIARTFAIAFDRTGAFAYVVNGITTFGDYRVSIVDMSTRAVVATIPIEQPGAIVMNPVLDRAYVGAGSTVVTIDTVAHAKIAEYPPEGGGFTALDVDASGTRLYAPDAAASTVDVIDAATQAVIATVPGGYMPSAVSAATLAQRAYVFNGGPESISVIDTATNTVAQDVPLDGYPVALATTEGSAYVFFIENPDDAPFTNRISALDVATNAVLPGPSFPSRTSAIAMRPDGAVVYYVDGNDNAVRAIDAATRAVIATIPVGMGPQTIALGPVLPSPPMLVAPDVAQAPPASRASIDIVANDTNVPPGASFAVIASTCPGTPASVDAHGVLTVLSPSLPGQACSVTVEVCAPAVDGGACLQEASSVTATTAVPVPAISRALLLVVAGFIVASTASAWRRLPPRPPR
jgi:YVTN family beta-propeller protein